MVEKTFENKFNLAGVKASTWARIILLIVAIINRVLLSKGLNVLPVNEATANTIADGFVAIIGIICYWYNNSWTEAGQAGDLAYEEAKNPIMDEYIDVNDIEAIESPEDIEE